MPQLDVSDILTDIDFVENWLLCNRNTQTIGENGMATITPQAIKFSGVVTSVTGAALRRTADGEYIYGDILICTRFRLSSGDATRTADTVTRGTRTYTVVDVNDYSRFGRGFIQARCDLTLPLSG